MAQLFGPAANTIATGSLFAAAGAAFLTFYVGSTITRSPYNTKVDNPIDQPVPFSHKHHAKELGIDCRFCHGNMRTARMPIPGTNVCMTCHSQVWTNSPLLEPVRESWETGTPIRWNKVNTVPDFVYFDHSIHIERGISCNNCHGKVQEMHITWKGRPFRMAWCLECHRDPENYLYETEDEHGHTLSPKEGIFRLYEKIANGEELNEAEQQLAKGFEQQIYGEPLPASLSELLPDDKAHKGIKLLEERQINKSQLMDCYVCHR